MRLLRNCVALVSLCLILAAPAMAAEGPRPAREETGPVARLVHGLGALLKAVWENEGFDIDPWGRPTRQEPPAPGTDDAFQIDPLG